MAVLRRNYNREASNPPTSKNSKVAFPYETSQGNFPVFEFIQNLNPKIKSKVIGVMDLLKELGTLVGPPHSKKVTSTPLWELRILGSDNIRIFYVAVVNRKFLLLHGFQKKKQKTDAKEIKTAIDRLNAYNHAKTDT